MQPMFFGGDFGKAAGGVAHNGLARPLGAFLGMQSFQSGRLSLLYQALSSFNKLYQAGQPKDDQDSQLVV